MQRVNLRDMDLCFIDIETTGSVIGYHEIIELGAIRTPPDAQEVLGECAVRVMPVYLERATPFAMELNGFSIESWKDALPLSEGLIHLAEYTRSAVPVCHNPSFDRAFIQLAASSTGVELGLDYHWIGTESLAWSRYKQGKLKGLQLHDLCAAFGIDEEPIPHRALDGARACLRVYRALMSM